VAGRRVSARSAAASNIGEITTRSMLKCRDCKKQFSYKVGTIFEDSPLGLDKWFVAVWCIANAKNGISSHELGRAFGVTQKTAWFMLHRIREAMTTGTFRKLTGTVESDETFIGGEARNMHVRKREKRIRGRARSASGSSTGCWSAAARSGRRSCRPSMRPSSPDHPRQRRAGREPLHRRRRCLRRAGSHFVHEAINHAESTCAGRSTRTASKTSGRCSSGASKGRTSRSPRSTFSATSMRKCSGSTSARTYRRLCEIDGAGFMGLE
jgi:transposase-like protein